MNVRTRNNDKEKDTHVGEIKSHRSTEGSNRSRGNTDNVQKACFSTFLETIGKILKDNFKTTFYRIRVLLSRFKEENLKKIA